MRLTFLLLLFSTSLFGQEMMLWSNAAVTPPISTITPDSLSGLVLYINPRDINSITESNGVIISVEDQTIYNNDISQNNLDNCPEHIQSIYFNNQYVMEFDDVTGFLADYFDQNNWSGTTPSIYRESWSFCVISRWTDPGDDNQRAFSTSTGGADYQSGGIIPFIENSNGPSYSAFLNGFRSNQSNVEDTPIFWCSSYNGSVVSTYKWTVGGSSTPSVVNSNFTTSSGAMTIFKVGGEVNINGQSYFSGEMGELMFWNEPHTQTEFQNLFENYIKTDYGF